MKTKSCLRVVESGNTQSEVVPRRDSDLPGGSLTAIPGEPEVSPLPNPWLFDSAALLRELDRIRETALDVPINGDMNATHFGLQIVVNTIWTLRENIRYMLAIHRDRQVAFGQKLKSELDSKHQTIYALLRRLLISCEQLWRFA